MCKALSRAAWSTPEDLVNLAWGSSTGSKALRAKLAQLPQLPLPLTQQALPFRRAPASARAVLRLLRLLALLLALRLLAVHFSWDASIEAKEVLTRVFGEEVEDLIDPDRNVEDTGSNLDMQTTDQNERNWLKAGSLYQNSYMTLWNEKGFPISVTLRIYNHNKFEIRCEHLNSIGGGSAGWMSVHGSFHVERAPGVKGRLRLVPNPPSGSQQTFVYDESILDSATRLLYRCMKRLGMGAILGAVTFEVDVAKDAVHVQPSNRFVKALWNTPVVLGVLPSEAQLWKPRV